MSVDTKAILERIKSGIDNFDRTVEVVLRGGQSILIIWLEPDGQSDWPRQRYEVQVQHALIFTYFVQPTRNIRRPIDSHTVDSVVGLVKYLNHTIRKNWHG